MCRIIPLLRAFCLFFFPLSFTSSFLFSEAGGFLLGTIRVQIRYIFLPSRLDRLTSPMALRSQSNARAKQLYLTWLPPWTQISLNDPFRTSAEVRKQQALELEKSGGRGEDEEWRRWGVRSIRARAPKPWVTGLKSRAHLTFYCQDMRGRERWREGLKRIKCLGGFDIGRPSSTG